MHGIMMKKGVGLYEMEGVEVMSHSIIETNFKFTSLTQRKDTKYIVIHNVAGESTAERIHQQHINQGWAGIGYHFFIDNDGGIWRGRPLNSQGAHVELANSDKVGICLNGNLDQRKPTDTQIKALLWLLDVLKQWYPNAQVKGHRDFNQTACPGRYVNINAILAMEVENEVRYNKIDEIPAGDLRDTIKRLVTGGIIKGNELGNLDLSMDMIRNIVIADRISRSSTGK
jgi:N-acetylmuramoyl-L-alanine amidase CwlA